MDFGALKKLATQGPPMIEYLCKDEELAQFHKSMAFFACAELDGGGEIRSCDH